MLPKRTLNIKRLTPGNYNLEGDWVEGLVSPTTIETTVQPLRGKEMELLPEGRRDSQAYKLYPGMLMLTADTSNRQNPDQVQIDNEWYEAVIVEPWQNAILNHYKTIVVKL
ncbi:hypothetical protein KAR91_48770 [Candidatus Pacearchaeota archaeon]|nr:hypothetical protein [Candidatus Pacearchaeota archaeon]